MHDGDGVERINVTSSRGSDKDVTFRCLGGSF